MEKKTAGRRLQDHAAHEFRERFKKQFGIVPDGVVENEDGEFVALLGDVVVKEEDKCVWAGEWEASQIAYGHEFARRVSSLEDLREFENLDAFEEFWNERFVAITQIAKSHAEQKASRLEDRFGDLDESCKASLRLERKEIQEECNRLRDLIHGVGALGERLDRKKVGWGEFVVTIAIIALAAFLILWIFIL